MQSNLSMTSNVLSLVASSCASWPSTGIKAHDVVHKGHEKFCISLYGGYKIEGCCGLGKMAVPVSIGLAFAGGHELSQQVSRIV